MEDYTKTNTVLIKEIMGENVQVILTVEGKSYKEWATRHEIAIHGLFKEGYIRKN